MVSKVRDFLMDEGFIEYVLGVSPELVSQWEADRKSTRLNSSHNNQSRMPSSA